VIAVPVVGVALQSFKAISLIIVYGVIAVLGVWVASA
jgi:hypothetical protein